MDDNILQIDTKHSDLAPIKGLRPCIGVVLTLPHGFKQASTVRQGSTAGSEDQHECHCLDAGAPPKFYVRGKQGWELYERKAQFTDSWTNIPILYTLFFHFFCGKQVGAIGKIHLYIQIVYIGNLLSYLLKE